VRALPAALAALLIVLAAGCATAPPSAPAAPASVASAFEADGRLSARHGSDAVAVHFAWRHAQSVDDFDVATPLGQVVARMRRDASGVRVERPNEAPAGYADWGALTQAVLGVAIPVDGLASWIQGVPDAGAASDVERDAAGRAEVLRQQGWEIVYAYADGGGGRPSRVVMRYPGSEPVEVRIAIDRFTRSP